MEHDRSPFVRLAALRERARAASIERLTHAAFDANAEVRFFARRFLARLGAAVDYRAQALAMLAAPHRDRQDVIGALATLSEFGRAEDLACIEAWTDDDRPSVAREARRTCARLRG
jgi:hypothetical protein